MRECSLSVISNCEREPAAIAGSAGEEWENHPDRKRDSLAARELCVVMVRSVRLWKSGVSRFLNAAESSCIFSRYGYGYGWMGTFSVWVSKITTQHHWATTKLHAHHHRMQLRMQFQLHSWVGLGVLEWLCQCLYLCIIEILNLCNKVINNIQNIIRKKHKNQPEIINTSSENEFPKCQSGSNKFKCERRALKKIVRYTAYHNHTCHIFRI